MCLLIEKKKKPSIQYIISQWKCYKLNKYTLSNCYKNYWVGNSPHRWVNYRIISRLNSRIFPDKKSLQIFSSLNYFLLWDSVTAVCAWLVTHFLVTSSSWLIFFTRNILFYSLTEFKSWLWLVYHLVATSFS